MQDDLPGAGRGQAGFSLGGRCLPRRCYHANDPATAPGDPARSVTDVPDKGPGPRDGRRLVRRVEDGDRAEEGDSIGASVTAAARVGNDELRITRGRGEKPISEDGCQNPAGREAHEGSRHIRPMKDPRRSLQRRALRDRAKLTPGAECGGI